MDWLTALAEVEQAAVRYQRAWNACRAFRAEHGKDPDRAAYLLEDRRLSVEVSRATQAMHSAAMLLPLDGTEVMQG